VLTLPLAAQNVWALGSDTVFISGYGGITYDSNLFRLPNGVQPPGPNGSTASRDAFIYNIGAGISADVPYSRQRFQANLIVNDYKYTPSSLSYLDYVGGSGRAAWLWQAGDDWSGSVAYGLSRALQTYTYTFSSARNIIDTQYLTFAPRYRIAPNWELQAGANYTTVSNSAPSVDPNTGVASPNVNDYNQLGFSLGTRYITPSGNSVGVTLQSWNARFPNQVPVEGSEFNNAYRETRLATFFDWIFSGASKIDGNIGYVVRRHDDLPERDFHGVTGAAGWTWTPSDKTSVRLAAARTLGGLEDLTVTYARTYTLSVNPSYQLTGKVRLNGIAQYQNVAFLGDTGIPGVTSPLVGRVDRIGTLGAGLTYQATRTLQFGLNYAFSHRNSNVPSADFNDQLVSLTGQLRF
jgi:exopolysaccharide biosynthesis operon protein EpsL